MKKTPLTRSEIMTRVRSTETSIEVKLRKMLWHNGFRYRKNCKDVFGKPDICFKKKKIAIFCDSEFWHGKRYLEGKSIPKTNRKFWIEKFERNIARDKKVTKHLEEDGWIVLRFWEEDINKNIEKCVSTIINELNRKS